ncbi:ABC transporter ATP-binding protein [Microbacterium sp. ARD32]|uniref:ABC transporter ATP-binding protein n=1 Tax=Microbacterium sp. ARD32 TaxID=2962577 RepID=UPI002881E99F|nr:ABC transporter ATP-binding protein [Microbacterium sp. ARD32]MDT0158335.1 ABC transporter ATP-binding protein [Microbacterium sp. ARD32]
MTEALVFDDVSRTFRAGAGVSGLDLRLDAGEIVALVGLNGAGKTTLMRLALGMLRPHGGTVRVLGQDVARIAPSVWARVGSFIETPPAYPELTVRENLRMTAILRGVDERLVEHTLKRWNLDAVADRRFRRLSLGNRQRTGLAAALQHDPDLIVLDEPGNALDPTSIIALREHLLARAASGAAVLVSSHHLDEMARIADRIVLMNAGRLIGELDTSGADLERVFFESIRQDDERREPERAATAAGGLR